MAKLQRVATQFGFDLVYSASKEGDDVRVPTGSAMILMQNIRGVGTEIVGKFRVTKGGLYKRSWNGDHIDTEMESGYTVDYGHPSDWAFFLDGKQSTPHDDPSTPWALFGEYEFAPSGERLRHTTFWVRKAAREAEQEAAGKARYEAEQARRLIEDRQALDQLSDRLRARSALATTPPPRPARRRKAAAPTITDADRLRAELARRAGSVIEQGVRVIAPNRFKSYYATLVSAAIAVGADEASLRDEIRRGEVEVLSEEGGYGGSRGFDRSAGSAIAEYVVHDGLRLLPQT